MSLKSPSISLSAKTIFRYFVFQSSIKLAVIILNFRTVDMTIKVKAKLVGIKLKLFSLVIMVVLVWVIMSAFVMCSINTGN